jgi:hypothetical protein
MIVFGSIKMIHLPVSRILQTPPMSLQPQIKKLSFRGSSSHSGAAKSRQISLGSGLLFSFVSNVFEGGRVQIERPENSEVPSGYVNRP